jgi:hypothetical protein
MRLSAKRCVGVVIISLAALALSPPAVRSEDYPEAGVSKLRAICAQREAPEPAKRAYCDCYIELVQKTVPWHDFLILDSALGTNTSLDAQEKSIRDKGREVALFCSLKTSRGFPDATWAVAGPLAFEWPPIL